jgi:predicted nucleic acid-binding protein
MIFLDTSAIYAWSDERDPDHETAVLRLRELLARQEQLLTHNYVVLESVSLLQARLGFHVASKFIKDCDAFVMEWVDDGLHTAAVRQWEKSGKRRLSLVDQISFLVMKRHNLQTAFAFDPDFQAAGFRLLQ